MNDAAAASSDRSIERRDRILLVIALFALGALYLFWFRDERHAMLAYAIFALPPLLLSLFVARGARLARFWSGVLALLWFSHGVMIAWSDSASRSYAIAELVLAIAIVFVSSAGGLRARARKRKAAALEKSAST